MNALRCDHGTINQVHFMVPMQATTRKTKDKDGELVSKTCRAGASLGPWG